MKCFHSNWKISVEERKKNQEKICRLIKQQFHKFLALFLCIAHKHFVFIRLKNKFLRIKVQLKSYLIWWNEFYLKTFYIWKFLAFIIIHGGLKIIVFARISMPFKNKIFQAFDFKNVTLTLEKKFWNSMIRFIK